MYTYLWEYVVAPENVDPFLEHYGRDGSWVRLFRGSVGYLGTSLLRDRSDRARFITIDRWESKEAHDAFLEQHGDAYAALDAACGELIRAETLLGHFDSDR